MLHFLVALSSSLLASSRTSGNVFQTASCYLEAIRPKVPELVRQEEASESVETRLLSEVYSMMHRKMGFYREKLATELGISET
jgi:hypothetical protein